MHDDEIDVDGDLVRRLLETQFPQWAELGLVRVEPSGTDNAIYRLGDSMSVRLPRIHWAAEQPRFEQTWLPRLSPHLPLPVPAPLALGEPGEGYPHSWAIHSWLPGTAALGTSVHARELAAFVVALQHVDVADAPEARRGRPLSTLNRTPEAIEDCRGIVDVEAALAVWEGALAAAAWDRPPVWIHGDLDRRNLLVDERDALCGVLDFSCAGVGDPAHDVGAAWRVLASEERAPFLEALDVDEATVARARGWIIEQAANALRYYTMENNPTLVLEARRWLDEVL